MTNTVKIKWIVSPVPTGRYRSFEKRGWPMGEIENKTAVRISCVDEYIPAKIKTGNHAPITVYVREHTGNSEKPIQEYKMKRTFETLKEAKKHAVDFFNTERGKRFIK